MIENLEYEKSVENAIMFLKGETSSLFNKMEHDMIKASENKNYELAAKYRDNIALVRDITSHYSIFLKIKVLTSFSAMKITLNY